MICHYVKGYTRENGDKVKGYVRCRRGNPQASQVFKDFEDQFNAAKAKGDISSNFSAEEYLDAAGYHGDYTDLTAVKFSAREDYIKLRWEIDGLVAESVFMDMYGEIDNKLLYMDDNMQGRGLGTRIFTRQVIQATKMGYKKINGEAAHMLNHKKANGHYTWLRLGYIPDDKDLFKKWNTVKDSGYYHAQSFDELFAMPGGREYWIEQGVSFHMHFDLNKGSMSRKQLAKYWVEKKKKSRIFAYGNKFRKNQKRIISYLRSRGFVG